MERKNNIRTTILGEMLDLIINEKNFPELQGIVHKDKDGVLISNEYIFRTPYVGRHNFIKVIIPHNFFIDFFNNDENLKTSIFLSVEYQIGTDLFKNDKMLVDNFFTMIKNLNRQK